MGRNSEIGKSTVSGRLRYLRTAYAIFFRIALVVRIIGYSIDNKERKKT